MRRLILCATAVALLAGCGSSSSSPPTARAIAAKIPGCAHFLPPSAGLSVYARTETTCQTSYAWADVATFASSGDERSWMRFEQANGTGICCLEGSGWAADVQFKSIPADPWQVKVARAAGGRWVSVP